MRFPDSFLDDIRDRLPISEVVGARVAFDKKKTNRGRGDFWGCCPFHGEKTPSFHCEDRKGRYHCFGCGQSGDHFRFLVELDGLSFPEAVERLADQAGVPMPILDRREQEREEKRATLFDVMDLCVDFYKNQLQAPAGAAARAYLRDRGIGGALQEEFGIGFSPDSRNALKEFLASRNISQEQMIACGMLIHGDDIPVSYDRFRGRIMFPIPDSRGRTIAFGGRALNPEVPAKYLNSPESELFHKSNVLYNYLKARKSAYEKKQVIACEGYMDVIALHSFGFPNAVAPLGTALTERQMLLLWKMHSEPILCFDGDDAGVKAAYRAIEMVLPGLAAGRSVKFAMLPEGLDPDDLLKRDGPQAMQDVLNAALPLADMIWNRETAKGIFDTPEQRAELEKQIKSVVALVRDDTVRHHYDQHMRERLAGFFGSTRNNNNNNFKREFNQRGSNQGRFDKQPWEKSGKSKTGASPSLLNSAMMKKNSTHIPQREAALVLGVVNHPAILTRFFEEFSNLILKSVEAVNLRQAVLDMIALHPLDADPLSAQELRTRLMEAGFVDAIDKMDKLVRLNRDWHVDISTGFEDAFDGWMQSYTLHVRNHTLHMELQAAEIALANDGGEEIFERLQQIKNEIAQDEGTEALIDGFGVSSGRPSRGF